MYKCNSYRVIFYAHPLPKQWETFNDTAATFSAGWNYRINRSFGDYQDDVHITTNAEANCDFSFRGEVVEILSEKFAGLGEVKVVLDGETQGNFSPYQDPMPRLYQVPFHRNLNLALGRHKVRAINLSAAGAGTIIDGIKVYGDD